MAKLSFLTFARDRYLPTGLPTLAPTTHDTVQREVSQLIEEFGRHPLAEISAEQVEQWWARLLSACARACAAVRSLSSGRPLWSHKLARSK